MYQQNHQSPTNESIPQDPNSSAGDRSPVGSHHNINHTCDETCPYFLAYMQFQLGNFQKCVEGSDYAVAQARYRKRYWQKKVKEAQDLIEQAKTNTTLVEQLPTDQPDPGKVYYHTGEEN